MFKLFQEVEDIYIEKSSSTFKIKTKEAAFIVSAIAFVAYALTMLPIFVAIMFLIPTLAYILEMLTEIQYDVIVLFNDKMKVKIYEGGFAMFAYSLANMLAYYTIRIQQAIGKSALVSDKSFLVQ